MASLEADIAVESMEDVVDRLIVALRVSSINLDRRNIHSVHPLDRTILPMPSWFILDVHDVQATQVVRVPRGRKDNEVVVLLASVMEILPKRI